MFVYLPDQARSRQSQVFVDLLFGSSGIEDQIMAFVGRLEVWPQVDVPVTRVGHLIALKLLSRNDRRLQDWRTTQGQPRRYYVLSAEGADLCERLTASWRGLNKTMDHLLEGERCDDR